ncbi:hypothetical protein NLM24_10775 [Nocardia zapadnayensis]|uniref:hypothetical protein n=1 Tax=Nocardia rhamnosiphila TaxID=426716 RepID=UPI002247B6F8|nr:hypothetical protein [Nocardia zapadnayensis]MCX0271180.1 hypothetical protein [Nocardia zapadnayensis]
MRPEVTHADEANTELVRRAQAAGRVLAALIAGLAAEGELPGPPPRPSGFAWCRQRAGTHPARPPEADQPA